MELLNRLTIKNLKLNKKRTAVTIIGIILATALITGVATLVTSFRSSIIEMEKKETGNYHYAFEDVKSEDIKYIENNRNIERTFMTQGIGYSKLEDSKNEDKPYLYIQSFQKAALENLGLKLEEGRFPENENEIVISKHIQTNGKVKLNIGDEITLDIGKRILEGEELGQNNPYNQEIETEKTISEDGGETNSENIKTLTEIKEEFIPEFTKKYKIVGIIERPNYNMEQYSSPGYTVITYMQTPSKDKKVNIYTRYKNLKKQNETTASILGLSLEEYENYFKKGNVSEETARKIKFSMTTNDGLIRWENLQFSEANTTMLYTVAAVIIGIIIITSVFCIRNSFAISITEKIKQYGMLSSIGATAKQIRKNVLYEGLILGIIGIPLGILSGLLAIFILLKIVEQILAGGVLGIDLIFKTNLMAILLSILLSGITIYLSAKKSAKKASKVSPIEAIRSNQDIKIKSKKLKSPKLINKLFGIGGTLAFKNLKRNNKKYRTTVISIVVSVSIFISMTSFMNYAFKTSNIYYKNYKYNIYASTSDVSKDYDTLKKIAENEEVKSYSLIRTLNIDVPLTEITKHYTNDYKEYYDTYATEEKSGVSTISAISLGKEEYERYIKELGLNYKEVKDTAILINKMTVYTTINGKSSYKLADIYDYKKGDKISAKLGDNKSIDISITQTTDKKPMGLENTYYNNGCLIISDELIEKYKDNIVESAQIYMNANDTDKLEKYIETNFKESNISHIYNVENEINQEKSMWLVIAIFLYGFITVISLIGVTNIFNTITTNMELRQKEFANLKSIGMTKKEFNKMISLESIFYGSKSLIIGIPIGIALSYGIYKAFGINMTSNYELPIAGIIISIIAVALLVGTIMRYSLSKINKQNIIETIRKDNI